MYVLFYLAYIESVPRDTLYLARMSQYASDIRTACAILLVLHIGIRIHCISFVICINKRFEAVLYIYDNCLCIMVYKA